MPTRQRGWPGSELHVLTDAAGLALAVATSAANTHDSLALMPLVQAIPAIRSRRGPRRRRRMTLIAWTAPGNDAAPSRLMTLIERVLRCP